MIDAWIGYFPTAKFYLMNINATGNAVGSGGTGPTDTGFNAIHAAIANVAATNPNVAGYADMNGAFSGALHYATAPEIDAVALRAFNAIIGTEPLVLTTDGGTVASDLPTVVVTQSHTLSVDANSVASTLPNVTLGTAPASVTLSQSRTAKFDGENRTAVFDSEVRIALF
jgi:hypothetical protein